MLIESPQALIRWTSLSEADDSWDDIQTLQQHYPSITLEDKGVFLGGSDVMNGRERAPNQLGFKPSHVPKGRDIKSKRQGEHWTGE